MRSIPVRLTRSRSGQQIEWAEGMFLRISIHHFFRHSVPLGIASNRIVAVRARERRESHKSGTHRCNSRRPVRF